MEVGIATALVIAGLAMLSFGLLSRLVKRLFLSGVLLALLTGIAVGPESLGLIDPSSQHESRALMEDVARITLAIALMGAGLHVTAGDLRENLCRCAGLLSIGMVGMWLITALGAWLLLDLPLWAGLLLGAILTPTDPVVASVLVTGPLAERNLPRRLRRTLQIESGANDGLALPLVLLAALMLAEPGGATAWDWAAEAGQAVGLAVPLGLAAGYGAGRLVEAGFRAYEVEEPNLFGIGLALALLVLGAAELVEASGLLAVFTASLAFSLVLEEQVRERVEETQETVTNFLILPAFILFGTILPWNEWQALGVSGLLFAVWVVVARRPLAVPPALAAVRCAERREAAFLGWFGPLGMAAILYATLIEDHHLPGGERIFAAATLAITTSILVHTLTATPGVRAFAGRSPLGTLRHPLDPDSETAP